MTRTPKVEIDRLPLYLSEPALAKDWLRPEEEEAWANWQQEKSFPTNRAENS